MKRPKVGNIYFASDYREPVMVLAIEQQERTFARCLVRRPNGETTSNYPSYLLRKATANDFGARQ